MEQADILGMGTNASITGKITGKEYNGVLHHKNDDVTAGDFHPKYIVIDVKTLDGEKVTDYYSVMRFENFSPAKLQGEKFLVVKNEFALGGELPMDDIRGIR
jgi:hypothetical protein